MQQLDEMRRYTSQRPRESESAPQSAISRLKFAQKLDISLRTVDNWRKSGLVRAVKIGGAVRIPASEVDRLLSGVSETEIPEYVSYAEAYNLDHRES